MTFHHVRRIEPLQARLYIGLKPGGCLCIADLDSEDGQFHDDATGVFHKRFDREALRQSFTKAGFAAIRHVTATEIMKPARNRLMSRFTVFMMIGEK